MNGIEHIEDTFFKTKSDNRAALMPYYTLGYPDADLSPRIIEAIAEAGADLIELGIPFSDPLADGPTIQRASQIALENGITVGRCLQIAAQLRQHGISQPLVLMGYYNPILNYGVERFVGEARLAGADGFIIPDLPPQEGGRMRSACQDHHMALIYLLTPNSTRERIRYIASLANGFLYLVSITGVTGARKALPADLLDFISSVRQETTTPLAVGFGISTQQQARMVGSHSDGVIVGSALIEATSNVADPCQSASRFITSLRQAMENNI
jgi:tryptophan synthase alpha chain